MKTHCPLGKHGAAGYLRAMPTAKKTPARKATAKTKPAAKKKAKPSPEHTAAHAALKLVDEAAELLRKGITTGASTSEKAREEAKKKAHTLLTKASGSLEALLSGGTSVLRKTINKI